MRWLGWVLVLAWAAGCVGIPVTGERVRVGSKEFTESRLLAEMYAQVLEHNGISVQRKLQLGGTEALHQALTAGEIDLYPEYTGTAYRFVLGLTDGEKNDGAVYRQVAEAYCRQWGLIWLEPAPMNNAYAIAVTQQAARDYNLRTLSDLARAAPNLRFVSVTDFNARPDGLVGMQAAYGKMDFKEMLVVPPDRKYEAVRQGQADAVLAFSTDGQIKGNNLVLLEDDRRIWQMYQPAPVVRQEVLARYPQIAESLNRLSPLLSSETMLELNWRVEVNGEDAQAVARDFLIKAGLIR